MNHYSRVIGNEGCQNRKISKSYELILLFPKKFGSTQLVIQTVEMFSVHTFDETEVTEGQDNVTRAKWDVIGSGESSLFSAPAISG